MSRIEKNSRKDRSFGIFLGLMCVVFFCYQYLHEELLYDTVAAIGLFLLILSFSIPVLFYPFRRIMEVIGHFMGIVNTYVLLTAIFIFLFIPIGLILKITGKDNLKLKWDSKATSYWIEHPDSKISSMKNQF